MRRISNEIANSQFIDQFRGHQSLPHQHLNFGDCFQSGLSRNVAGIHCRRSFQAGSSGRSVAGLLTVRVLLRTWNRKHFVSHDPRIDSSTFSRNSRLVDPSAALPEVVAWAVGAPAALPESTPASWSVGAAAPAMEGKRQRDFRTTRSVAEIMEPRDNHEAACGTESGNEISGPRCRNKETDTSNGILIGTRNSLVTSEPLPELVASWSIGAAEAALPDS